MDGTNIRTMKRIKASMLKNLPVGTHILMRDYWSGAFKRYKVVKGKTGILQSLENPNIVIKPKSLPWLIFYIEG